MESNVVIIVKYCVGVDLTSTLITLASLSISSTSQESTPPPPIVTPPLNLYHSAGMNSSVHVGLLFLALATLGTAAPRVVESYVVSACALSLAPPLCAIISKKNVSTFACTMKRDKSNVFAYTEPLLGVVTVSLSVVWRNTWTGGAGRGHGLHSGQRAGCAAVPTVQIAHEHDADGVQSDHPRRGTSRYRYEGGGGGFMHDEEGLGCFFPFLVHTH